MPRDFSVAEAKAHFSDCLRSAEQGDPVVIKRHGKAVAAIVRAEDLEELERLRAAGPAGGLASVAGGWARSEEIVEILEKQHRSPARGSRQR